MVPLHNRKVQNSSNELHFIDTYILNHLWSFARMFLHVETSAADRGDMCNN